VAQRKDACLRGHDTSFPEARIAANGSCKQCSRERRGEDNRRWRAAHPDYDRQWRQAHRRSK
jgi:hypothetical protein